MLSGNGINGFWGKGAYTGGYQNDLVPLIPGQSCGLIYTHLTQGPARPLATSSPDRRVQGVSPPRCALPEPQSHVIELRARQPNEMLKPSDPFPRDSVVNLRIEPTFPNSARGRMTPGQTERCGLRKRYPAKPPSPCSRPVRPSRWREGGVRRPSRFIARHRNSSLGKS